MELDGRLRKPNYPARRLTPAALSVGLLLRPQLVVMVIDFGSRNPPFRMTTD